jgi:HK97 family phage major capsid protein
MNSLIEKRTALLNRNMEMAQAVKSAIRPFSAEETKEIATNIQEAERLAESIQLMDKITPAPVAAPAPSLVDSVSNTNFRTLRTVDGREVRAFGKGQKMADSLPMMSGELDLEGFGRGLAATISGNRRGAETECRALSEGLNSGGGFFVSEALSAQLIDLARNKSRCFEAGALALDMPTEQLRMVTVESDPSIALVGENSLIGSSDPSFNSRLLTAKKHGCLVKVSNELMADGMGAGEAVVSALAQALGTYVDDLMLDYLFTGAGLSQTDSVAGITYDDVLLAQYSVRALNIEPTAMIANSKTLYALSLLRDVPTGSYLAPPAALASIRMLDSGNCADSHCIVGAFENAVIATRGGLSIELSREAGDAFAYDQTFVRLLWRGDVGVLRKGFHVLDDLTY